MKPWLVELWKSRVQYLRPYYACTKPQQSDYPINSRHVWSLPLMWTCWSTLILAILLLALTVEDIMDIGSALANLNLAFYLNTPLMVFWWRFAVLMSEEDANSRYYKSKLRFCPSSHSLLRNGCVMTHPFKSGVPVTMAVQPLKLKCRRRKRVKFIVHHHDSRRVISLLLMLAGDVETNPGPVSIEDLHLIKWEDEHGMQQEFWLIDMVSNKWRKFGQVLGLTESRLTGYHAQCLGGNGDRFDQVMKHWLNGESTDYPVTWDGLYALLKDTTLEPVVTSLKTAVENAFGGGGEVPKFDLQYGEDRYREKMPQNYPEEGTEEYQELKRFSSKVELILLTINKHEYRAAAIYMEKPSDKFDQAVFIPGYGNIVVGMFAKIKTALIQSDVGSRSDKFIKDAIDAFPNAHFIIGVGVCYAFDRSKHQLGDVLISKQICDLADSKFSKNGTILNRGETIDVSIELKRFYMDLISDFYVTDKRRCKVYSGQIASLPYLIDNKSMQKKIRDCVKEAIGGEMEGGQLLKFQKKRKIKGVIIIKGVADYGDGSKSKEWQFTSAMAAVHYTHSKLEQVATLSIDERTDSSSEQETSDANLKEFRDNIEKHMKKGKVKRRIGNLVFIGLPRAGKTALIANLLNLPINIKCSPSTNVMNGIITVDLSKDITTVSAAHISDDGGWTEVQIQLSCLRQMGAACILKEDTTALPDDQRPHGQDKGEAERDSSLDLQPDDQAQSQPDSPVDSQPNSPQIGRRVRRSSSPTDMSKALNPLELVDKLIKENKREDILLFLENKTSLYLSDTGGQIEFQELLPLLISPNSVFLFLFAMDKGLNEKVDVSFREKDGEETNCYTTSTTVGEFFMKTLSSIDSMEAVVDEHGDSKQKPHVFVVGTHRDVLEEELGPDGAKARIAELNKELLSLIEDHKYKHLMVMADDSKGEVMFAIDNTPAQYKETGLNSAETRPRDYVFRQIRSRIRTFIEGSGKFNVTFPLSYLLASLELQQFEDPFVERTAFSQAIAKYGIEEEDIDHLLRFLQTKIGLIRYFPIKELERVITRSPQVLYDLVSELLILSFRGTVTAEVFSDLQKGIYSLKDLEDRFAAIPHSDLITLDMVILLLKELRIMAPFYDRESEGDKFFVPCVINHLEPPPEYSNRSEVQSLAIRFNCGNCPKGMFGVLIHCLLTQEKPEETMEWVLDKSLIFRDEVSFKVGVYGDKVTLKSLSKHLELSCHPTRQPERCSKFDLKVVCHKVRSAVLSGITQATSTLHYDKEKTGCSLALIGACESENCAELHQIKQIDDYHKFIDCAEQLLSLPPSGAFWFGSAPAYKLEMSQIDVTEGDKAEVKFQVTQDPPLLNDGRHTLLKKGVPVCDTRITIAANIICFSNIRRGDAGKYTITSSNGIGLGEAFFTLCFSGYELDDDYVEAKDGELPTLHFNVTSNPPLDSSTKHIITNESGKTVIKFKVQDNCITFRNVKPIDTGLYTISCGLKFKATFMLVISASPSAAHVHHNESDSSDTQIPPEPVMATELTITDKADVYRATKPAAALWEDIGLALKINPTELEKIEHDISGTEDRLKQVLSLWLKGNGGECSWRFLCAAMRDDLVARPDLAKNIEKQYLQ